MFTEMELRTKPAAISAPGSERPAMRAAGPPGRPGMQDRGPARTAVARASYDPEFLYQIIEVIGSGPDLDTILHGFVPLVTAATECHGCFIYFVEDGHLVMRIASAGYAQLEGKVRLRLDEGLAGWVARTRRSAFIKDRALEDARVVYVPELEEEQYQSLVAVPILSRAGQAIGVITLHARAPHEFRKSDVAFLENSASLIAGAIENARLYEEAIGRVKQLTELSVLAQQVAHAASIEDLLRVVAEGCRKLLNARECKLYLCDQDEQLELAAATPQRTEGPVLDAKHLWSQLVATDGHDAEATRGLAELVWSRREQGIPLFAALSTGEERVGLLCVLVEQAGDDRKSLLASVASHTAVAIKRRQLIDSLEAKTLVKDFFEALASGNADIQWLRRQAAKLQCDLEGSHLVVHAAPWTPPGRPRARAKAAAEQPPDRRELGGKFEARLKMELPKSLFDLRESSFRGLLRVPPSGVEAAIEMVRRVFQSLGGSERVALAIGLSNTCQGLGSLVRGFEEAESAAQVGSLLRGGAGVFAYEELGAYRYVLTAETSVRDRYQEHLERVVEYEERRGTELLRTLEVYLENLGSIGRTAQTLHMHPNTLRQRLSRIEQLTQFDLDHEDWLSLGMAIKIVKLRIIRASKPRPFLEQ